MKHFGKKLWSQFGLFAPPEAVKNFRLTFAVRWNLPGGTPESETICIFALFFCPILSPLIFRACISPFFGKGVGWNLFDPKFESTQRYDTLIRDKDIPLTRNLCALCPFCVLCNRLHAAQFYKLSPFLRISLNIFLWLVQRVYYGIERRGDADTSVFCHRSRNTIFKMSSV